MRTLPCPPAVLLILGGALSSACQSRLDDYSVRQDLPPEDDASLVVNSPDAGGVATLDAGTGAATCAAGSFVKSPASDGSDLECEGCPSGSYSDVENAVECANWTSCQPGEYVSSPGSAFENQKCEACPEGQTSAGMNAGACSPLDACPSGTVEVAPATADETPECEPCEVGTYCAGGSSEAAPCPDDTWDHDQDPSTTCAPQTNCGAGQYVGESGTAASDRICGDCDGGSFTLETNAEQCEAWAACEPGSYIATPGSPTRDQVCADCASGTFSEDEDAPECNGWTVCQPGEFIETEGSVTGDQICQPCADGEFSTAENSERCVSSDECPPGTLQISAATAESPPECEDCSVGEYCFGGDEAAVACSDGDWDHDANPATPCAEHTQCLEGSFVDEPGDATTDRSCSACASGTFTTSANAESCDPWTTCAAGTSIQTAASSTSDRVCAACSSGTFSSTSNAASCSPWSVCSAPSFRMSMAPSATNNRQCVACTPPGFTSQDNATTCQIVAFQMSDGQVVMEAENYDTTSANGSTDSWSRVSISGISGDEAMELGPDDASSWTTDIAATAPRLVYYVNFTTTGTFYLYLRGDAGTSSAGTSDSCHAGIDNSPISSFYDFNNNSGVYGWLSQTAEVTSTGVHTVTVWGREDGFRIDKIVVSTSATAPTGNGPAESPRG